MPIMTYIRDNWCRFQGELFPEIRDAVGPLHKDHRNYSGTLAPINWSRYSIFINNLSIYKLSSATSAQTVLPRYNKYTGSWSKLSKIYQHIVIEI